MFEGLFNGVMGKIKSGCCRLGMNGRIAIKTSDGYKTYDPKTGNVTNCSNFVLDICDDMFMVIPTRKLKEGDIVLINGKPMYILEVKSANRVEAMNYEDSTIQTVIPERHVIMGRKFYGKIISLIGSGFGAGKGGFFKNMLKLKMMSSMMGGKDNNSNNMFGGNALPMMMLMGNGKFDTNNPMLMMSLLGGKDIDPMTMMMLSGNKDIDPTTMMLLMNSKGGDSSKMLPFLLMKDNAAFKDNPMMLSMLMGGTVDTQTLMLMQMMKGKGGKDGLF